MAKVVIPLPIIGIAAGFAVGYPLDSPTIGAIVTFVVTFPLILRFLRRGHV